MAAGVEVQSSTQKLIVKPIENQSINARPNSHVSIVNAGPVGPASTVPGPPGEQGPPGPTGAPGATSGAFTHHQSSPSDSWVIVHNLGFYPAVTVIDSAGSMVEGDVHYDSLNQITLSFSGSFSGIASLS